MKSAIFILLMCVINIPFIVLDPSQWWNWMSAIFCFGLFIWTVAVRNRIG